MLHIYNNRSLQGSETVIDIAFFQLFRSITGYEKGLLYLYRIKKQAKNESYKQNSKDVK